MFTLGMTRQWPGAAEWMYTVESSERLLFPDLFSGQNLSVIISFQTCEPFISNTCPENTAVKPAYLELA